jgi:hypothetical protein
MDVQRQALIFPAGFCCNCGDTNCVAEAQETRITRFFGLRGTGTTFNLSIPICAACRKTTRRRPAGFFHRLLVFGALVGGWFLVLVVLGSYVVWPPWIAGHRFAISVALGLLVTVAFYRLRRARPPKTSFYQPVRIKDADVQFADVMSGPGQVVFMKLAFTNPDYLNVFTQANREAIQAGYVVAGRA